MSTRAPAALARAWLPVVVWCAVIFALSAVPSLGTGLGTWDLVIRKLAHMAEYAILAALLVRAGNRPAVVLALGGLYAVSDEVHQTFVQGREGRARDVAIDVAGLVIGLLVARSWSLRTRTA